MPMNDLLELDYNQVEDEKLVFPHPFHIVVLEHYVCNSNHKLNFDIL